MSTTVSSEPEPVKFELDHLNHLSEDHDPQGPTANEKEKKTSSILVSNLRKKIEELFAIDLRSLALTRIAVAMLVLVDLLWRFTSLGAFYSDKGLVPRAAIFENGMGDADEFLLLTEGDDAVPVLKPDRARRLEARRGKAREFVEEHAAVRVYSAFGHAG